MAITIGQIPAALQTVQDLHSTLSNMSALMSQAKALSDAGWVVNIGTTVQIPITVTPAMQASLIDQYNTLKTQLVSTFQQLP